MNAPDQRAQNISFRDPGGHVFRAAGRIFRAVGTHTSPFLNSSFHTDPATSLQHEGKLGLTADVFATALTERFRIEATYQLEGMDRILYLLSRAH